jgi:Flp pilus assembly protein TadG
LSAFSLRNTRLARGEHGQAIVLIALFLLVLLMGAGLAVDAGQLYSAKRTMQEAADAAAFAGGVVIYQGGTKGTDQTCGTNGTNVNSDAYKEAVRDATRNGFTDGVNNTTVTVNNPPLSGTFCGNSKYVEVIIVQQVRTTLVPAESVLNPVRARGVGGADPGKSPFAVVLLKTTGPCLSMGGAGNFTVPNPDADTGGMIQANCSGTSMQLNGGSLIDPLGVRTVGTVNNPAKVNPPSGQPLTQNASLQPDPFAGFPKPPCCGGLPTFTNYNVPGGYCSAPTVLTPGVYVGGITNSQNCDVILGSGVFILKGGGFNQNASSGNIITQGGSQALGAMIFNTHSNYPGAIGGGSCGSIQAQSGGGFNTWAMGSGLYAGMAVYQDAACTNAIAVVSNGSYFFHGTLYAPSALLDLQSQSSLTLDSQLVVSAINFQSTGDLTVNYHKSLSAQQGLPTLVE